ncbi:MAG: hypothetical protein JWQ21_3505 [Herminiimonas sp.]|nr:hypothetical protein [Herminiimonas sp.]
MNTSSRDAGIPVLTEIIDPPAAEQHTSEVAVSPPSARRIEQHGSDEFEAHALSGWNDEEWNRMERKIRERILRQLMGRIDTVLEQHVRDSLADVLQTSVERLAAEIKDGLHHTMEEMIARTVSQEITRLQTTKK